MQNGPGCLPMPHQIPPGRYRQRPRAETRDQWLINSMAGAFPERKLQLVRALKGNGEVFFAHVGGFT